MLKYHKFQKLVTKVYTQTGGSSLNYMQLNQRTAKLESLQAKFESARNVNFPNETTDLPWFLKRYDTIRTCL